MKSFITATITFFSILSFGQRPTNVKEVGLIKSTLKDTIIIKNESKVEIKMDVINTKKSFFNENSVILTVLGIGKSIELAKINALHNAIEQTYTTFISSKKETLNQSHLREDIISESSKIFLKCDFISQSISSDGDFIGTYATEISLPALQAFVISRNITVEFNGNLFSQKIKLQRLKEEAENVVIKNLCLAGFEILKKSVDFEINTSSPVIIGDLKDEDDESLSDYKFTSNTGYFLKDFKPEDFIVKFSVKTKHNSKYFEFLDVLKKNIESLSMNNEEIEEYKGLNKGFYVLKIDEAFYYLRKKDDLESIYNLIIKTNIYPLQFKISSNVGEIIPLLKYRFPMSNNNQDNFYNRSTDYGNEKEFNSLINAITVNYDWYYIRTEYNDYLKNRSIDIFEKLNIYPYYKNLLQNVYSENYHYEKNNWKIHRENIKNQPNNFLFIDTSEVYENNFNFSELFTLEEIEKIDNFHVTKFEMDEVLQNEEVQLKNVKLVKLDGGGFEEYEDFYGRKFNNYEQLVGNGCIARLIEKQKNRVLVKMYKRKCIDSYCYENYPGKLFFIPITKVLKYMIGSEIKNEDGILELRYN